jgi:hypothetical protein
VPGGESNISASCRTSGAPIKASPFNAAGSEAQQPKRQSDAAASTALKLPSDCKNKYQASSVQPINNLMKNQNKYQMKVIENQSHILTSQYLFDKRAFVA